MTDSSKSNSSKTHRKSGKDGSERGAHAFEVYYRSVFGSRWELLKSAMTGSKRPMHALSTAGETPYYMDAASLLVVAAAGSIDCRVLDMCAAPGGKTLAIATSTCKPFWLVANERSSVRRARLHRVVDEHLSTATRANVVVTGYDARRWGIHEPQSYDLVVADVPCSSEAHLLNGKGDLGRWSESRIKQVTTDQFAILRAATQAVRPGGHIIYSTCSLLHQENEGLIARAIERGNHKGPPVRPLPAGDDLWRSAAKLGLTYRASEPGYRIWPDENEGAGPIYFCKLERCG